MSEDSENITPNTKKSSKKITDKILIEELGINKEELKKLKKKLSKVESRPERGIETLYRLLSKNQYTLNVMIDRKSNILISINALILSIVLGTVLNQLDKDPHLLYPAILILGTNLVSIAFAIFATRPELSHGDKNINNILFYGNFKTMEEEEYVQKLDDLMYQGDNLYKVIARDTFYLGKTIDKKFRFLRHSFHIFLVGIIGSVIAFILCHAFFS